MVKNKRTQRITYTNHAKDRINRRRITEKWVEETILNPDVVKSGRHGKKIAQRMIDSGGVVEVVYVVEDNQIVVITTYWG